MTESKLKYLYQQYIDDRCTEAELQELKSILIQADDNHLLKQLLEQTWLDMDAIEFIDIDSTKADILYHEIVAQPQYKPNFIASYWIHIAATVILCISAAVLTYIYQSNSPNLVAKSTKAGKPPVQDIMSGSNKAILTLGNGKEILLDDSDNGQVAIQTDVVINKLKDGQLVYSLNANTGGTSSVLYNKIATPTGGQYNLILPDGTKVYLNAESTLEYPTKFIGKERNVSLTGEAYFEVAKNSKMPFKVNVNNKQQVEVLGTHFNIMAYHNDHTINTTLIEGSVKVHHRNAQVLLKPGQTAINNTGTSNIEIVKANVDEVTAWKSGYFIFNNENIKTIMQKLARWYNMDVSYEGDMTNINFLGNYSYSKSLANLLKSIELTQRVHFKIEGRRVTVVAN